jgi:paraquat-inducible protein A
LPANVLPVLTITRFGRTEPYTILGGVRDLAAAGLWPLALLVLFASILVPVLKLAGLSWFLIAIRLRWVRLLRERTAFYRLGAARPGKALSLSCLTEAGGSFEEIASRPGRFMD